MYQKILVAVDGSATSDRGLAEAVQLAKLTGGRLRLVNVVDDMTIAMGVGNAAAYTGDLLTELKDAGEQTLEKARATVAAAGIQVDAALLESLARRVSDLVVEEAARWGADLIVLGTHGRRGVRRLVLGSDAEQILRVAPIPVLLVRSAEPEA
jgi:nucleotide-binding universal stress UspA family protein